VTSYGQEILGGYFLLARPVYTSKLTWVRTYCRSTVHLIRRISAVVETVANVD